MFKRILLTTDLSAASDAVINCMEDFKTLGVEEITLFLPILATYKYLRFILTNCYILV